MKACNFIICPVLAILFVGCARNQTANLLNDVESYISERPDSALAVLDTMDRSLLTTDRLMAHHALLHAMALDKNFIDVDDDSLASVALSYYSKRGPEKYEARSRYYLGLSYYYAGEYEKAILEFTKAEKVAERSDSLYWGFVNVAQADTYRKTHNNIEECNCLSKASCIFTELSADYYKSATNLRLAQSLYNNGDSESSEHLLQLLTEDNEIQENIKIPAILNLAFMKTIASQPNYNLSVQLFEGVFSEDYIKYISTKDYWSYIYALYNVDRHQDADALMLQLKNIDTSATSFYWQYLIEKNKGNYLDALTLLEKSVTYNNDEVTAALKQSLALSQRDYYETEFENASYKAENRKLVIICFVVVSVLILALVLWGVSVYARRQREEKEYYLKYADEIRRQLEASKREDYPELKRKYLEIYRSRFEMIGTLYEEYVLYSGKKNAEHAVYEKVAELLDAFVNDDNNKKQLESVLDDSLDGIVSKLRKEMPRLKETDYLIFSFMIIGFDPTTISHFLNISMNAVYIRKSRMKQHIEEAGPEHKDIFLEVLG